MKKITLFLLLSSVLLLLNACQEELEETYPKRMDLSEAVYASGYVEAQSQYKVFSTASGILQKWYVTEGDTVSTGQKLLSVEGPKTTLNTDNARLAMELAEQNSSNSSAIIQELEYNIQSAYEKYLNDSMQYERLYRLHQKNIGSRAELDRAQLLMKTSKNNFKALKRRLNATRDQLEIEMKSARNRYKINKSSNSDLTVKSQLDGVVYSILKEQGELIMLQEPLAVVGLADRFVLRLAVDELDLGKISIGNRVLVNLDAYSDQVLEASLTRIYPLVDKKTQTLMVEAVLLDPPPLLTPGLSVEANIIIAEKKDVLVIPRAFLIEGDSVRTAREKGQKIKLGLQNMEYVEVLEGIDEQTPIYRP